MNNLQTAETPTKKALSRRDFLKASGALFVTFSAASVTTMEPFSAAQGPLTRIFRTSIPQSWIHGLLSARRYGDCIHRQM